MVQAAWLGLGAMGRPMAGRLLNAVELLTVYDPAHAHAAALGSLGAQVASTPEAAARGCDLLFLMVATPEQAEQALFGQDGAAAALSAGSIVVVMSTIGTESVRALAERLTSGGVSVVDAPVSGGTARAESGELLVMLSGPSETLAVARPLIDQLGSQVVVVGSAVGDGQAVKVVNQLLCGVHIVAAAEAVSLAAALGLEPRAVWETIRHGAAGSFMLENRGARMLDGAFEPVLSAVNIFVKDLGLVTGAARARHFPTPLAATAEQLFLMAEGAGLGHLDDSAIVTLYERSLGRPLAGPPEGD